MDIQEYISSGIVESYVLGLCSAKEMQEVETLSAQHTDIQHAIHSFEEILEKQAFINAVSPPASLKDVVMESLKKEEQRNNNQALITPLPNTNEPSKVVSITAAPKSIRWLRGAIAASIILLLGSIMLNFYYYSQYRKFNVQYSDLLAKQNTVLAKNDLLQASYNMVKDTTIRKVPMVATPQKAGSLATILWDSKTKDVYLMVNNLPQPAQDKQYQLWAIVDGKPVDAGMVDMNNKDVLIKMHNIPNAQAFAITLEQKGGSPSPTMEEMYVFGKA